MSKTKLFTAREAAKDLIRSYVERGDTVDQLARGRTGSYSDEYCAQIGGYVDGKNIGNQKIIVRKVKNKKFEPPEIFSLQKIFDEIKNENA